VGVLRVKALRRGLRGWGEAGRGDGMGEGERGHGMGREEMRGKGRKGE